MTATEMPKSFGCTATLVKKHELYVLQRPWNGRTGSPEKAEKVSESNMYIPLFWFGLR